MEKVGYGNYILKKHKWEHYIDSFTLLELLFDYFKLELKHIDGKPTIIKGE